MGRIELPTSPLPRECSTTEPHGRYIFVTGAGEGNRTLVVSLEGFCSTIELHPHGDSHLQLVTAWIARYRFNSGGGGWIRTSVGVSQQIYSLPPLATRAPLRRELTIMRLSHILVNTGTSSIPALIGVRNSTAPALSGAQKSCGSATLRATEPGPPGLAGSRSGFKAGGVGLAGVNAKTPPV